jgi:hypothetical protein
MKRCCPTIRMEEKGCCSTRERDWEEGEIPHRTVDVCGRTTRRICWLPQSEVNSVVSYIHILVDNDDRRHNVCCSMYGNNEIHIYNAINVIFHH